MKRNALGTVIIAVAAAAAGAAEPVEGFVTYVTTDGFYIDAGRDDGVQQGDSGYVVRGEERVAELLVEFTADNSSSCRIIPAGAEVRVGDEMVIHVRTVTESVEPEEKRAGRTTTTPDRIEPVVDEPGKKKKVIDTVSGYVGLQYWNQGGDGSLGYGYSHATTRLSLKAENIRSSNLTLSLNLRTRRTDRDAANGNEIRWDNRFYELELNYANPSSPFGFGFGRTRVRGVAGAGRIDGAYVNYRPREGVRAGAFLGTDPDYEKGLGMDEVKVGVYAGLENSRRSKLRWSSSLALLGVYDGGEIDEEYLYLQADASKSRRWSIYTNARIDINRGWRGENGNAMFQLAYLNLNSRYSITDWLSLNLGYDHRRNVRTIDNREVSDSLFDDALREGLRGGFFMRLPGGIRVSADATQRTSGGDSGGKQPTMGARARVYDLFGSDVAVGGRLTHWENLYTEGSHYALDLNRSFFRSRFDFSMEAGQRDSRLKMSRANVSYRWLNLTGSISPYRRLFLSAGYELNAGDDGTGRRVILDGIVRF